MLWINCQALELNCGKAIVQAEDEIASAGMVAGAGWAGARAMTSTSGPGVSLTLSDVETAPHVRLYTYHRCTASMKTLIAVAFWITVLVLFMILMLKAFDIDIA